MRTFIYTGKNGGCSIEPSCNDEAFNAIRARLDSASVAYRIIDSADIPQDTFFRDAWRFDPERYNGINIHTEEAKKIKISQFRDLRKPILAKLDVEFMRALEDGNQQELSKITEKKRALRNVTEMEMPSDMTELRNFIPSILR